jgi:ABC-2 type transport system ATP-binding protein
MTPPPVIRLRGLRKRFGARTALAGIDLDVGDRQIFGVTGPDGAGKTTLLRTLVGLLDVDATEASVLGHDLRGDVTALKAQIGYVPQAFSLHRDLTVADNLRFTARVHRLATAALDTRMADLLARTQLAPFADRLAGALSGGMKQKLAIANALLPTPALLVLDEPTAGVDVLARAEIWSILDHARATALVVVSTSYLDETERCDQLLYLDEGRVVAMGTPSALRAANPRMIVRAWGDDARAIARAARALPFVIAARSTSRFARLEVRPDQVAAADVTRAVERLPGVRFVEWRAPDIESTLRHLAMAPAA